MSTNVPGPGSGDGAADARAVEVPGVGSVEPIPHAIDTDEAECDHVAEHLWEYLDSEMTAEDAARMRAHLAHCSPCLAELSLDELVRQLLRRSCADRAPATLRARLYAQFSATAVITREV